jgi:hypothetical protein
VVQVLVQVPLVQVAPAPQAWPQVPQLAGSVSVFTHMLLQTLVPAGVVLGPHVPFARPVLALLQPWQDRLHAPEQQTPSVEQKPLTHWVAAVQVVPVAFLGTHVLPEQKSPEMQSLSAAQVVLQAVGPQMYGVQFVVTPVGQLPAPLHVAAAVATPAVQLAPRHETVLGATWQAPPVAHSPVLPQGGALPQRASAVPASVVEQVPLATPVLAAEQAVQVPLQTASQQKLSTHEPEAHCAAAVQAVPLTFRHCEAAHTWPPPQTMPQPPQLLGSDTVVVQVPPQTC